MTPQCREVDVGGCYGNCGLTVTLTRTYSFVGCQPEIRQWRLIKSVPKCAIKLETIQALLDECYTRGVPDHLEEEHQLLMREFKRLHEEWKAHRCDDAVDVQP